jgi:nucleotide-binding universal stress UspA family protein
MFQKIIVPIDLEEESSWHKVLPVAVDYCRHAGAELHVMTVVPDQLLKMTVVAQLISEDYEQRLMEDVARRCAGAAFTRKSYDTCAMSGVI